jgi:hypothetical protein
MSSKRDPCVRASTAFQKQEYQKAIEFASQCQKEIIKLKRNKKVTSDILTEISTRELSISILKGNAYYNLKDLKNAEREFEMCLHITKRENHFKEGMELNLITARVNYSLGVLNFNLNKTNKGLQYLKQANELFKNSTKPEDGVETALRLAEYYRLKGNEENSIYYFDELNRISKKVKGKGKKLIQAQVNLGKAKSLKNFKESEKLLNKAEKQFSKLDDLQNILQVKLAKALLYLDNDRTDEGKELLESILVEAEKKNYERIISEVKYTLGLLDIKVGNIDAADSNITEGLVTQSQNSDPNIAFPALLNLAKIFYEKANNLEDVKSAMQHIEKALELSPAIKSEKIAPAYELYANMKLDLDDPKEAESSIIKARRIYSDLQDSYGEARSMLILSEIKDKEQRFEDVISILDKVERMYSNLESNLGLLDVYQRKIIYYFEVKQDKELSFFWLSKTEELITDTFKNNPDYNKLVSRFHELKSKIIGFFEKN